MGRRNQNTREEIRAMAVAAARDIVVKSGVRNISVRKVAAAIGYGASTLYWAFENLDEIILRVNDQTNGVLFESMKKTCDGQNRPSERLIAMAESYVSFAVENKNLWLLAFAQPLPDVPQWYSERIHEGFKLLEEQLALLVPERSEKEIKIAAYSVWSGVHGVATLALTERIKITGLDPLELQKSLIGNYLNGFTGRFAEENI